jgi:predicted glycoside hydrolase/deacetylase ChbG (UPF0249 family)
MNPYLKQLGFDENDRVVVIHADDVGMCQATIPAFADLVEFGLLSSGAVMVPCPWFLEAAAYCRQNPTADMGVHLTLTSEWKTYRWGPISTSDPSTGLIDEDGYFHHRAHQAQANGDPGAVQIELKAQLERALEAGIDVTHLDTHMGTLAHPKFIPAYIQLGRTHNIPVMIPVDAENDLQELGLDHETTASTAHFIQQEVNTRELIQIDRIKGLRLDQPRERLAQAESTFDALQPGLTHFVIHPAKDSPELRAATSYTWQCRVGDYEVFRSEEFRSYIKNIGIQVIGYRPLRKLLQEQDLGSESL